MTTVYNPKIVTDGLVLYLDAGNTKSYPGSGTSWSDLSGKSNNGTLTNGPTYSSDDGGSIVFDGTDDYVSNTDPNLSESELEGNLTFEYWLKPTQTIASTYTQAVFGTDYSFTVSSQGLAGGDRYKYNNSSFAAFLFSFGTNGFAAGAVNNSYGPAFLVDYQTYSGISHLVVIKNASGCSYYVNGVFKKSTTQSRTLGVDPTLVTSDRGSINGKYFKGNIYSYKLYKKALTAAEIKQNYNALKRRFV